LALNREILGPLVAIKGISQQLAWVNKGLMGGLQIDHNHPWLTPLPLEWQSIFLFTI